jgi:mediator of RNA polymerase II transcription subunit 12
MRTSTLKNRRTQNNILPGLSKPRRPIIDTPNSTPISYNLRKPFHFPSSIGKPLTKSQNVLLCHHESLISSIDATKLQKLLSLADTRIYEVDQRLQNVTLRASFFEGGSKPSEADPESPISGRRKAVEYLDSIGVNFASSPVLPVTIYQRLNSLLSSDDLVSVVFEWAVTSLRSGQYRVYLAVEIFKLADADNVDIQTTILELLGQMDVHRKVKKEDVFLLISELVRTRNFKLNSYLRWLVSSGGTSGRNYYDEVSSPVSIPSHHRISANLKLQSCPYHIQLLAEIPMRRDMDLPIRSLRNNLLLRCGFDFTHEERSIGENKQMLLQKGIFALTTPLQVQTDRYVSLERHEEERIRNSTRAAKTDLAQWVLDGFRQLIASRPYPLSLPITQIILIRDVLELLGNAPMLLEVGTLVLVLSEVEFMLMALVDDSGYQ